MCMILFYMKLFAQLTINRFNHLPNFVNPPLRFFGDLLFLVWSRGTVTRSIRFLGLSGQIDLGTNIGHYHLSHAWILVIESNS